MITESNREPTQKSIVPLQRSAYSAGSNPPETPTMTPTPPLGRAPQPDAEFMMRDTTSHPSALAPAYKTSVLRSPRLALISLQHSLSAVSYTHLTLPTILRV